MPRNERETPNDKDMPVDVPGETPAKRAPVEEPAKREVPERDPTPNDPPQQAPTDPDIAQQGRIEVAADDQRGEPRADKATIAAANGQSNPSIEGP